MKFLRVDYAFESHPVLSPVHRVSISVSPYLFSHSDEPVQKKSRVSPVYARQSQEPLPQETPAEDAEQAASEIETPEKEPPEEARETPDEVLESSPAGGVYWEE